MKFRKQLFALVAAVQFFTATQAFATTNFDASMTFTNDIHSNIDESVFKSTINTSKLYTLADDNATDSSLSVSTNKDSTSQITLNTNKVNNESNTLDYSSDTTKVVQTDDTNSNINNITVITNSATEQNTAQEKVIYTSNTELSAKWEELRIGESEIGNLISDAYASDAAVTIAFENAGAIKAGINKGDISNLDITNILPDKNYIVTKQITGKDIKSMMETSIDILIRNKIANENVATNTWPNESGEFLNVSGLKVKYDPTKEKGMRIISLTTANKAIEDNQAYTVAVSSYLAESTYYPELKNSANINKFSACDEAVIKYLEAGFSEDSIKIGRITEAIANTEDAEGDSSDVTTEENVETTTEADGDSSIRRGGSSSNNAAVYPDKTTDKPNGDSDAEGKPNNNSSNENNITGAEEEINIMIGYEDGSLKPEQAITRAEFVSMLCRAKFWDNKVKDYTKFSDVGGNEWYYEYLVWAVENEFIYGYTDGTFKGDRTLSVYEANLIIDRLKEKVEINTEVKTTGNTIKRIDAANYIYSIIGR